MMKQQRGVLRIVVSGPLTRATAHHLFHCVAGAARELGARVVVCDARRAVVAMRPADFLPRVAVATPPGAWIVSPGSFRTFSEAVAKLRCGGIVRKVFTVEATALAWAQEVASSRTVER